MTTGKRLLGKLAPFATKLTGIAEVHRLAILYLLLHDPLEFRDIVRELKLPANAVFHHVKQMHKTGWLKRTKVGKSVTYEINPKAFRELHSALPDTYIVRELTKKD